MDHVIKNPGGVRIGRLEKPDLDAIQKAPSWEKLYELCKESRVHGAEYEDLILGRLTRELGLNEEKSAALKKLFKAEQESATLSIIESSGGVAAFERKKEELLTNSKVIFDEWRRYREVVRRMQDVEYMKIVTYDQLGSVNEHLRNAEISLENSYDAKGAYYLFGGVGKAPK